MSATALSRRPRWFAKVSAGLVFLVGVLVLFGWVFGVPTLTTVLPGQPRMAAAASFALILAAVALWLVNSGSGSLRREAGDSKESVRLWCARGLAMMVAFIGLLRLCDYLMGWELGIDQLFFEKLERARVAPATALNFLLLGCALLLSSGRRFLGTFQSLTLLAGLIGWLGFSYYLYGGDPLLPFGAMAVHTAGSFVILSAGVLCTRTDGGLIGLLISDEPGGLIARRLLPPALLVPVVVGWLRLQGQGAGWFGTEAGVGVFALANVVIFGALVWAGAALLQRTDSARRGSERALRESEERHSAIVDVSMDAIITMSHQGRIVDFNPAAQRLFGYGRAAVIGRALADTIIPPGLREQHTRGLARYLASGEGPVLGTRLEITGLRADGSEVPVELTVTRMPGTGPPMFTGFVRDITERKDAERKLQNQLARLDLLHRITHAVGERQDLKSIFEVVIRTLEDYLPLDFCCVCLYDEARNSLTVTSVGVRSALLAMEMATVENARLAIDQNGLAQCLRGQLAYEPDVAGVQMPFPQRLARSGLRALVTVPLIVESKVFGVVVAARREASSFSSGECEFLRQLSEHIGLAAHHAQLYDALQQAYDDLRHTQQAILQQERLRALGQMASGIAHDINNAISPISLYSTLLQREPNLSASGREYLVTIRQAADDVAETVARLREFYRQHEPQLTLLPVDLNRVAQQVVDLTRSRWSAIPQQRGVVINMVTELAPDPPAILGVESELREALINLVFNAVDAMPEGGTLTLRTRVTESTAESGGMLVPRHVYLEVADTGVGMDEDTRRRCLEPFFTTKGERGTGLGLAMVYGVVQRHGAVIEIESTATKGTTMRLGFAVSTAAAVQAAEPAVEYVIPSGLKILVVDDDPLVLKVLTDTLEGDGHTVITANGGQGGIDTFREARGRGEALDIVITDLGMPYVDGRKVASAIKNDSPSTPVILVTGWGQQLVAGGEVPLHVDRVLSKPPGLRALREALAYCCRPDQR